jgi:SAM-dependent MidA family methyltransferase
MNLKDKLIGEILKKGRLSYADVVELLLYDPAHGYYRSGKPHQKDFLTSPEISPIFGHAIGKYLERVCTSLGLSRLSLLELGGASGELAQALISGASGISVERCVIVEKGEHARQGIVEWVDDLRAVPPLEGFTAVIANEFLDALPFHRIRCREGELEEIHVGHGDGFFEEPGPLEPHVRSYLERFPLPLPEGQVLEITPDLLDVAARLSTAVERGIFLVFDYGYHNADIAAGRFPDGSMVGYRDFMLVDDVLEEPGSADVTHHVNFDHLSGILTDQGWRKEGELPQYRFLFQAGMLDALGSLPEAQRLAAKSLIDPRGLGSVISTLAFTKNIDLPIPAFQRRC